MTAKSNEGGALPRAPWAGTPFEEEYRMLCAGIDREREALIAARSIEQRQAQTIATLMGCLCACGDEHFCAAEVRPLHALLARVVEVDAMFKRQEAITPITAIEWERRHEELDEVACRARAALQVEAE